VTVSDGALTASSSFVLTVDPVNDFPVLSVNSGALVPQGVSVVLTNGMLLADDADNGAAELLFTLVSAPAQGTLELSGAGLAAGESFTQAAVVAGSVSYVHSGGALASDEFTFTVADGAGGSIVTQTFAISVSDIASVVESASAVGLSGSIVAAPGNEVEIFDVGLTGQGGATVSSITVTLLDLSAVTGLEATDFFELRLYRSVDGSLDVGDVLAGTQSPVVVGSAMTIAVDSPAALADGVETFYIVAVVVADQVVDGHAFRVEFADGGVGTNLGGVGTAVVATDGDWVEIEVAADRLAFAVQPSGSVSGQAVTVQPVVQAVDGHGNLDLDFGEQVTLATTGPGALSGNVATAVGGVATFVDVAYAATMDGEPIVLAANDEDGTGMDFALVNADELTADVVATQLVFTAQPDGAVHGELLAQQPAVVAVDAEGRTDVDFVGEVSLGVSVGSGIDGGMATMGAGVATFAEVVVNGVGVGRTLDATSGGMGGVSAAFDVEKAEATVTLGGLGLLYDGTAKEVEATTDPPGLVVVITYDGNAEAPVGPGEFAVVATVDDPDYQGSASGSLVIGAILTESSPATGLSGVMAAAPGDEVELFDIGIEGNGTAGVEGVAIELSDLSVPTGMLGEEIAELRLYRSADGVLSGDDVLIGAESGPMPLGVAVSVAADAVDVPAEGEVRYYVVAAVLADQVVDGHAFRVGFVEGDATTGNGGLGAAVVAADGDRVEIEVVADRLAFAVQPADAVSGSVLGVQPVVEAVDEHGNVDVDFAEGVRLEATGAGMLSGNVVTAENGVATFAGVKYTAPVDGEPFALVADDDPAGVDLASVHSDGLVADVVADRLLFATEPEPRSVFSGEDLDFSVDPVVEARDAFGVRDRDFVDLVTLTAVGDGTVIYTNNEVAAVEGLAIFTDLSLIYETGDPSGESFALRADDAPTGVEGDIVELPTIGDITCRVPDRDGVLVMGRAVNEPVPLPSTADGLANAVYLFDFMLTDGGTADGRELGVSQVVVHATGTGALGQMVFYLDGTDASQVLGLLDDGKITFGDLSISVPDGQSETYAVSAYFGDREGLVDGERLMLSVDGDVDLMVVAQGTQMSGSNAVVDNGVGSAVVVTATELVFATQPAGSESGKGLKTQPVVKAEDAYGNVDVDFASQVTLGATGPGLLSGNVVRAENGVATFVGVAYAATIDKESFALVAEGGAGLSSVPSESMVAKVIADRLEFATPPAGAVHGSPLATQPVLKAVDERGVTDVDFARGVWLSVEGGSELMMNEGQARGVNGVATFGGVVLSIAGVDRRLTASSQYLSSAKSALFVVEPTLASVNLTNLQVPYDGTQRAVEVQTQPPGVGVAVTYGGSPDAPIGPGSFQVAARVSDTNYFGQANGTLVIAPPPPPVAVLMPSVLEVNPGGEVSFADQSIGFIDSRRLTVRVGEDAAVQEFIDAQLAQPMVVAYPEPGTYAAVLWVKGPGGEHEQSVSITVHAPPKVADIDPVSVEEDQPLVLNLAGKDAEPGNWSVEDTDPALIGAATVGGDEIRFAPVANKSGSDQVRIVRTNGYQLSTAKTVTLTWAPVDDAPVIEPALEAIFTTAEDRPIQVGGAAHALDVDTDMGTLVWSASGYDGELVISAQEGNGGVRFAPVENAHGSTPATIHLSDPATGKEVTQGVTLMWTPVNDAPKLPVALYPGEGISGVPLSPVLTWSAEDVDGDPLSYDVTLSSGGAPVMQGAGLAEAQFAVGALKPGTVYSWMVVARDAVGSAEGSFSFTTELDRQPPAVSDVRAAATHEQATVSWRTDEEATGGLTYRSVPEDGSSVVSGSMEQAVSGVVHQVTLSGLLPAMWYEYEVVAVDGAVPGNASAPVGGRFRTLAAPDMDPPQIQVGPYPEGIAQESAVVRWTTDELSTSVVRYWQVTGAGNGPVTEVVVGDRVDDHMVKLEGLVAGTIYGYEVQSLDGAMPVANASVMKGGDPFVTETERDGTPPAFEEGPSAQSVADVSAMVLLRASERVQVQVRFDVDADLSDGQMASSAQVGSEHQIALTGLIPETEYHYQVTLTDESGNPFASAMRSFATPAAPDTRPPGYLVPPGAESVTDVSAVLVLTADEPVRVQVLVAAASEPANTVLQESRDLKEGHALLLTNLVPETEYAYEVRIEDAVPNRGAPVTGGFLTGAAPDIDPPVVEGPFVEGVGNDGATVVFRTDEPSTGEVDFQVAEDGGESATGELRGKIVLTDLAREHRVQLTQLAADREYVVQVVARDGAQPAPNTSPLQKVTFHTRRNPDTEPPQKVVGPELVEVTPTRALLQVGFNEPVELEVRYSVHADLSGAMMRTLATRQKSHAVELVGLERETHYYVRLLARDAVGLEGELLQTELVTPLKEDGTPPRFVAMPVAIEVLSSSARVGFAVDEPVTAELVVSSNADLSDPLPVVRSTERSREQELRVSGLQPRRTYYFRVVATNGGGQTAVGGGDFKTTVDRPKLTPRIVVGPSQRTVEDRSVTLYLRANKPSVPTVSYRPANDPAGEERTETQTVLQKEHTLVLTNLEPATRYTYTAHLEDELGKVSSLRRGRFTTRKVADEKPPRMQGRPTVSRLRHDQATVFWRTNEAADSQVRVWADGQEWNVGDGASLRGHRLTVTNLEGGKEYSYQVSSTDGAGNGPTSSEVSYFTTPSSPDREAPQFTGRPIVKGRDFDSVVLSWSVDEPVSARLSYGETADFELGQEGRPGPESNWEWTLTGLQAETFYHVRISVDDARRNGPTVHEMTVETLAEPDRQSPEIRQGPIAVATTQSEAVIEWTTDEPADGKVGYTWDGGSDDISDPEHVLEHRMVVSGLTAGTTYSYTVSSQDIAQNPATVSGTGTFATKKAPDTTPPAITYGPSALDVTEHRATLFWTTDEPATSVVDYGTTTGYGGHLEFGELVQEHRVSLENLEPGAAYHFKVGSTDLAGLEVSTDPWGGKLYSVDHTFATQGQQDSDSPKFEQTPTVRWTNRTAVVRWTTDEVSTSRADWVGGGKDGFVEDNRLVRDHSLTLNRLRPRTGYRFMVRSEDRAGNPLVWGSTAGAKWVTLAFDAAGKLLQPPGGAGVFVTDNFPDSQLPQIISGPQVQEKTVSSLTVAWETDELADSFVRFWIDEGLEEVVGAAQDVQDHQLTVTGLVPGTTYHYRVESTDPSGNGATESGVGVVTTSSEVDLSPPRFVTQPQKVAVTDEELVIGWETDEAASARVEYQVGEEVQTRQVMERQTRHQVTLTNLSAETEYRVRVFVKDASQNEGGADVELRVQTESAPDLEVPRIVSAPIVVSVDDRSATIAWETDEVSDSFVDFDATPYLGQVVGSPAYVSAHEVTLTNLGPGTIYYYRVGSRDRASNGPVESQVLNFTTAAEADVDPPSVPEGLVVRAGLDANLLTWEECAEGDLAGYAVYREGGDGSWLPVATNLLETSYLDEGLEADREYRYRVSALDEQSPPNESEMSEIVSGTPSAERVPGKPEIRGLEVGAEPGMPVVVLENAEVGDPSAVLTYTIQLSTSPDFSDVVDRAGNVEEEPGVTRWRVTRELAVDAAYWCRARASDGLLEGPWSEAVLLTPAEVGDRALSSDFDGDGSVSFVDFFLFADGFGGTSAALDMDGGGRVDFADFFLFADDFGKTTARKAHRLREVAVVETARLELAAEAIDSRNILVQLRMDGMGKMAGYGARLSYDAETLSFVGLADSSGRLLGGPELSLLLTKEQEGTLRLTEHLRGKLEGAELPEGQVVQLLFALEGRPEGSVIRVEEGYISRNHRQVVAVGQLGVARVVPQAYALYPAYPNPFNPSTTIPLALPVTGRAELEVYNVLGQRVRQWDLSGLEPGFHAVSWDGMDQEGRGVGSGVYLVLLRAEPADRSRQVPLRKESFRQTRKILLLR
jgi:phosphodiesterase/alkaline phosphatase D-like protein